MINSATERYEVLKVATYGKGGVGKTTISSNLSVALSQRGRKVLQIGCDPKHDSTFSLCGFIIPTIIDTLQNRDFVYSNIWAEDIIYTGYQDVSCVEAGGPPAGAGCGGYVVGETVKLLKELNAFYEYDVIIFDVLGDIVCGGFAAPLNYSDYCLITTDNAFDALFAANRIFASVREKARTHPLRLAGLVINRGVNRTLVNALAQLCAYPIIETFPLLDSIRDSRVLGEPISLITDQQEEKFHKEKQTNLTLNSVTEDEQKLEFALLQYTCGAFLSLADFFLSGPEGVVPIEVPTHSLFEKLQKAQQQQKISKQKVMEKTTSSRDRIQDEMSHFVIV